MLEKYLRQADRLLKNYPISLKSDILAEITQDLTGKSTYPSNVLEVVNEKLVKRGVPPIKKTFSLGKWIFITTISSMLIGIISLWLFVSKFFPLISIDEKKGKVLILGGTIDINMEQGTSIVGHTYQSNLTSQHTFNGTQEITTQKQLEILIAQAVFKIKNHAQNKIEWECKVQKSPEQNYIQLNQDKISLNLAQLGALECDLLIPSNIVVKLDMQLGQLQFEQIQNMVSAQLTKGIITFAPHPTSSYQLLANPAIDLNLYPQYELNAKNGIEIKLQVQDGEINVR
jgi:hypothetical protein